jgi:hypothetical protein
LFAVGDDHDQQTFRLWNKNVEIGDDVGEFAFAFEFIFLQIVRGFVSNLFGARRSPDLRWETRQVIFGVVGPDVDAVAGFDLAVET